MGTYYVDTKMLWHWGACQEGREDALDLFPERKIPVTVEGYTALVESGVSVANYLGFLIAREDRWAHFAMLVKAEIAAERQRAAGDGKWRRRLDMAEEYVTGKIHEENMPAYANAVATRFLAARRCAGRLEEIEGGLWLLGLVVRTMEAVEPQTTNVYFGHDEDDWDEEGQRGIDE